MSKEKTKKIFKFIDLGDDEKYEKFSFNNYSRIARGLSMVDNHSILLLLKHPAVVALQEFFKEILWQGKEDIQCIYVEDQQYNMDQTILDTPPLINLINEKLTEAYQKGFDIKTYNFERNSCFSAWFKQIKIPTISNLDNPAWYAKYHSKAILHRHIMHPDIPALIEQVPQIKVPKGYICENPEQAFIAYKKLAQLGVKKMLTKFFHGSGGRGICALDDISETAKIDWEAGPHIITERLELDQNLLGDEANCGVLIHEGELFGSIFTVTLANKFTSTGAICPILNNKEQQNNINFQLDHLLKWLKSINMQGEGSFDFLFSKNEAWLVDNNMGRMGGTHFSVHFQKVHAPDNRCFVYFKVQNGEDINIWEVWNILQKNKLDFSPKTQMGVFPIRHVEGIISEMLAFGSTNMEAYQMAQKTLALLEA